MSNVSIISQLIAATQRNKLEWLPSLATRDTSSKAVTVEGVTFRVGYTSYANQEPSYKLVISEDHTETQVYGAGRHDISELWRTIERRPTEDLEKKADQVLARLLEGPWDSK